MLPYVVPYVAKFTDRRRPKYAKRSISESLSPFQNINYTFIKYFKNPQYFVLMYLLVNFKHTPAVQLCSQNRKCQYL